MTAAVYGSDLLHRNGEAISRRAVAGFCARYHVDRLSILPSQPSMHGGTESAQPMLVSFDPTNVPGKFAFLYMAIELSSMMGRRIDLKTDAPALRGPVGPLSIPSGTTDIFRAGQPAAEA